MRQEDFKPYVSEKVGNISDKTGMNQTISAQSCNSSQGKYRTDQDLMGQKDKKQPISLDHRKIDSRGRFRGADVRGYARMRKAMLEREKREKEGD